MTEFPNNFTSYLETLGMSNTLIERVHECFSFYSDICDITIDDIFVNEYINDEGIREYQSVWFMNEHRCMEAHDFTKQVTYDMSPWFRNIKRWNVSHKDFDFITPTEKSRLTINFVFHNDVEGVLKSSKENCLILVKILQKYIIPNSRSD